MTARFGTFAIAVGAILLASPLHAQTGLYIAPGKGYVTLGGGMVDTDAKGVGFGNVGAVRANEPTNPTYPQPFPPGLNAGAGASSAATNSDTGTYAGSAAYAFSFENSLSGRAAAGASSSVPFQNSNPTVATAFAVARNTTGRLESGATAEINGRRVSTWGGDSSLTFPIGWFADLQLSRGLNEPFLGAFNIVQLDLAFSRSSGRRASYAMTGRTIDGLTQFSYANAVDGGLTDEMNAWNGEATLKLKNLARVSDTVTAGFRVDVFGGLARSRESTFVPESPSVNIGLAGTIYSRELTVDSGWAGLAVGGEGSKEIVAGTSLFAGASAGLYGAHAKGQFSNDGQVADFVFDEGAPGPKHIRDESWRAGARLTGEVGVRVDGSVALTTFFFSADYRTAVARAMMPQLDGDEPAHIGWEDVLSLRSGVSMSFRAD